MEDNKEQVGCNHPDCRKYFDTRIDNIEKQTKGIHLTMYGEIGSNGLTGDNKDFKNDIKNIKEKLELLSDNIIEKMKSIFIRKIPLPIFITLLLFILGGPTGIAISTVYSAKNAVTKDELVGVKNELSKEDSSLKEEINIVDKEVISNTKDVTAIKEGLKRVETELNSFKEEVKTVMKDQKDDLEKQQKIYYEQIKTLVESIKK